MIFLVLPEICDFDLTNRSKISGFKFLSRFSSNVSVGYIIVLPLVSKSLSPDPYLKLQIVDKDGISSDFNQKKKVEYC